MQLMAIAALDYVEGSVVVRNGYVGIAVYTEDVWIMISAAKMRDFTLSSVYFNLILIV